jgi:hypothetical protein
LLAGPGPVLVAWMATCALPEAVRVGLTVRWLSCQVV